MFQICCLNNNLNPFSATLTAKSISAGTIVTALVAIGCSAGVLMILASQGVNIGAFNSMNASLAGGLFVSGISFLSFAVAVAWWVKVIKNHYANRGIDQIGSGVSEAPESAFNRQTIRPIMRTSSPSTDLVESAERSSAIHFQPLIQSEVEQEENLYVFCKTLTGRSIPLIARHSETLREVMIKLVNKLHKAGEDIENWNDIHLICAGRVVNRGDNLARTMQELNAIYEFRSLACLHLVNMKINPEMSLILGTKIWEMRLPSDFAYLQHIEAQDVFTSFQTAFLSYCDRILRNKFDQADMETLNIFQSELRLAVTDLEKRAALRFEFLLELVETCRKKFEISIIGRINDLIKRLKDELNDLGVPAREDSNFVRVSNGESLVYQIPRCNLKYSSYLTSFYDFSGESDALQLKEVSPTLDIMLRYLAGSVSEEKLIQYFSQLQPERLSDFLSEATFYGMHRIELLVECYLIEQIDQITLDIQMDSEESVCPYSYLQRAQEIKKTGQTF